MDNFKKENFLELLKNITPEQINKIIKENGTPARPIRPIVYKK